jgi:hypothetical protein
MSYVLSIAHLSRKLQARYCILILHQRRFEAKMKMLLKDENLRKQFSEKGLLQVKKFDWK